MYNFPHTVSNIKLIIWFGTSKTIIKLIFRPSRGVSREDLPTEKPPTGTGTEPQKVEVTADDDATLFRFGIRRSSDRRRKMSTTPTEPTRGTSSIKFQVPSRRKASVVEKVTTNAAQPQGREAIVYSPASSSFSMTSVSSNRGSTPCSDVFFGSGNIIDF